MIEERWADKREYRHHVTSLSTLVVNPDGELVELAEQIGEEPGPAGLSLATKVRESLQRGIGARRASVVRLRFWRT